MKKLVFDADGVIKIARAGLLEETARAFECYISKEVESEAVEAGRQRMYEDAFELERGIRLGFFKVDVVPKRPKLEPEEFGAGELSSLALFHKLAADAIVSDDKKFLSLLQQKKIPFTTPSQLVVVLVGAKKISRKEGRRRLELLRPWISRDSYELAFNQLRGE